MTPDSRPRAETGAESGQVIVLVVFLLIGIIAFAALAIDGGNAFFQRRIAQNGADNAAMAAAYYIAEHLINDVPPVENEILSELNLLAEANGIDDTDGIAGNEVNGNVEAYFTDVRGDRLLGCNRVGTCGGVSASVRGFEVIVHKSVPAFFAQLIGWNTLSAEGWGIAVIHYANLFDELPDLALYSVGACPDIKAFDGSGSNSEIFGAVHSNDDLYLSGSGYHFHGTSTSSEGYVSSGSGNQFPPGSPSGGPPIPNPLASLTTAMYAPGGARVWGRVVHDLSSGGKVDLGRLQAAGLYNAATRRLATGVYYGGNNEFDLGVGSIRGEVTIVTENSVKISGSQNDLTPYVDGLLIFSNKRPADPCKDWVIDIGGSGSFEPAISHDADGFSNPVLVMQTDHIFRGLIYAPRGQVMTSGSKGTFRGAIVGQGIKLNGSDELVFYDDDFVDPRVELIR